MTINRIFEKEKFFIHIKARGLLKQFQKAKAYILSGHLSQVNFKLKYPKEAGIYSFRINKQFRALCVYRNKDLIVFRLDNHQN